MTRAQRLWLGLGVPALALAVGAGLLAASSNHESTPTVLAVLFPIVGVSFIASGLVAWTRRPDNRTGLLLAALGFLWFPTILWESSNRWVYTFGASFTAVYLPLLVHLLLAYPSGRLDRRFERWLLGVLYPLAALVGFVPALFEARPSGTCKSCPDSAFLVTENHAAVDAWNIFTTVVGVIVFVGVGLTLVRRWRAATPAARRQLAPVYFGGAAGLVLFGVGLGLQPVSSAAGDVTMVVAFAVFAALPFAFLSGILRSRLARTGITRMLLDTPDEPTGDDVQTHLRRVLGDPTLAFVHWHPDRGRYVDAAGNLVRLPKDGESRVATRIDYESKPLAALVHDPMVLEDRALLDEVVATARIGLAKDRGYQALRQSEARTRALLDAIPDLMLRLSRDGTYLAFKGDPKDLARPPEQLIGANVRDVLPPEVAQPLLACLRGTLEDGEVHTLEYALEIDGAQRDFEARMVVAGEGEVVTIVRDFTERRRLEAELQARLARIEREQEFVRTVVNTAPGIFLLVDEEGRIVRFNRTMVRLFGRPDDDRVRGRYFWDVFLPDPEQRQIAKEIAARLRAGEEAVECETEWTAADGSRRVIASVSTPILDGTGQQRYLICGLDMTERTRQQEEVRASRARIVEAADQARRRLERNLHDGAQQRLVSLSLALRLAQAKLKSDADAAAEILGNASAELTLALEELRELARGLHPAILSDRGLGAALAALADRATVPVELEEVPEERLPDPVEAAAFYVVSESLANVAKYAQASCARVRVSRDNGYAVVEVSDDGVGGADPGRGSGLRGLHDRVEALDGRLELDSEPGHGTHVRALIPLQ